VSAHTLLLLLFPILLIAALLVLFLPTQRSRKQSRSADGQFSDPLYSDDDRYWYGFFYNNPDDPNPLVPKRYGLGWTINFGHPAGKLIAAVMVGMLLLPIALAIFDPGFAASGCHPANCHPLTP
jgi:uncharacterized membrane protein